MSTSTSLTRTAVAALGLSLAACAGANKIKTRELSTYDEDLKLDAGYDASKAACRKALERTGFSIVEERSVDADTWLVVGDMGAGFKSWGQFARIVVVRVKPQVTHAMILSTKKIDANRSEDLVGVRRKLVLNIQQALAE